MNQSQQQTQKAKEDRVMATFFRAKFQVMNCLFCASSLVPDGPRQRKEAFLQVLKELGLDPGVVQEAARKRKGYDIGVMAEELPENFNITDENEHFFNYCIHLPAFCEFLAALLP